VSTSKTEQGGTAARGASGPTAPTTAPGELSHSQVMQILVGLLMGMFLAALDQTIVSASIRTIGDDLHGLSVQAWVTTAYLITATITTPLYGKLSDIYGRKPLFLIAISIFITGSALSSLSTSMYMLAAFRAIQGLGAGGLFSLALAIIADIVPARERAKYQGYFLAVFGAASVLGPVIGGFLAGQSEILGIAGWRWVFLVNVPIGLVALVVVGRGSPASLACYAVGLIGLGLFVWAESLAGDEALIPLRFFRNRTFSMTAAIGVIVGVGMFGGLAALPLYLQIAKGASPTESGLLLTPLVLGLMVGSIVSGQLISRTGRYKIYPIIGAACMVLAMVLLRTITVDSSFWTTAIYMGIFGLGLGNVMQPITLAVQNALPPQDLGVTTSSATFFRQMGGTLGTAIFLSILFSTVAGKIQAAFEAAAKTPAFQQALRDPAVVNDPANRQVLQAITHGSGGAVSNSDLNDTSFIQHLSPVLARPFKVGFADSMHVVFTVGGIVLAIGLVMLLFLPEVPLRTQSGQLARRQEAENEAAA
jgi:MFS family permease